MSAHQVNGREVDGLSSTEWRQIRKDAGKKIDPETAEVAWRHAYDLDPYGIYDLPSELRQIGRNYFARSPGSDIWVSFDDLPNDIRDALWAKHKSKLAFPAGILDPSVGFLPE